MKVLELQHVGIELAYEVVWGWITEDLLFDEQRVKWSGREDSNLRPQDLKEDATHFIPYL